MVSQQIGVILGVLVVWRLFWALLPMHAIAGVAAWLYRVLVYVAVDFHSFVRRAGLGRVRLAISVALILLGLAMILAAVSLWVLS